MYEFHGWMGLAESPREIDEGSMPGKLAELRGCLEGIDWPTATAEFRVHTGVSFLYLNGLVNRVRRENDEAHALLAEVARILPGAWGLFYERADEFSDPITFRVRRLARGVWTEFQDSLLSPCNPTLED